MKKVSPCYIKHVYWLTAEEAGFLRRELAARKIRVQSAKGVVCTPLDELNRITVVAPEVWDDHCNRAGAWYRTSAKNGRYLVVSAFDLEGHEARKTGTITVSDFTAPRAATLQDRREMADQPVFLKQMPAAWPMVSEKQKKIYLQWAAKLQAAPDDFATLYLTQTANHANFVVPRFFIEKDGLTVPYSIAPSAHLCSCCLELFDVLGNAYEQKLVRPCPGAVFFARLQPDQYLLMDKTG